MKLVIFLFVGVPLLVVETRTLYDVAEPCRPNDSNFSTCFAKLIETAASKVAIGIPELNIPAMDPYLIPLLTTNITFENIVDGQAVFKNIRLKNILKFKVVNTKMDEDNLVAEIDMLHPKISAECEFAADGKFFESSIHAEGRFKGKIANAKSNLRMTFKIVEKEGVKYATILNFKLKLFVEDGLVQDLKTKDPNQQPLADIAHNLFNQNSRDYLDLLHPVFEENTKKFLRGALDNIFSVIPSNLFLPQV